MGERGEDVQEQNLSRPASLDEALERFQAVLDRRGVQGRTRGFYPVWVKRFDQFRVRVLKRSFFDTINDDVSMFLREQTERFGLPLWQAKQAREAIVVFLREVIGRDGIDARLVLFSGLSCTGASVTCEKDDESRPGGDAANETTVGSVGSVRWSRTE